MAKRQQVSSAESELFLEWEETLLKGVGNMPQIINTNLFSLNAQRNLNETQNSLGTSLQRLSSGLRINSAKDDAAGLAIAERFSSQIRGLNQAIRNANDGISYAQTAEGGLSTATSALQRIRELAVQSANDTNTASDREAINNEVQQLIAEVRRISNTTQFNGQNVLDGTSSSLAFQVGANQNQTITVDGVDARADILGARTAESGAFTQTTLDAFFGGGTDLVVQGISTGGEGLADGSSVQDLVNQINTVTAQSGIAAQQATTTTTGDIAVVGAAGNVTVNSVTVAQTGTLATDIAAINAVTGQTGVTASANGAAIVLSNSDGSDIVTTGFAAADNDTYQAGIVLVGDVSETNTDFAVTGGPAVDSGATLAAATQSNNTVTSTDVLTQSSSTTALLTLDFALSQVNTLRSELGAVQTRFESTISNLQITSENLTAARSRIQDADFAAETANLTRGQILQQAGLSIVAQANSLPQSVLSLLQ